MIPTCILIRHDGSRHADAAFDDALDLEAPAGARPSVVAVASPPEPPTEVEAAGALEAATRHDEELVANLRRRAEERHVPMETHILVGHPADQILRTAAASRADLIVVGHRGRSPIREWVFGSTSRRIVAHATCSVLVVRPR